MLIMDDRIIEQLKLDFEIEETLSIGISEEFEMELQHLAETHRYESGGLSGESYY
jgi:hypothetical protein